MKTFVFLLEGRVVSDFGLIKRLRNLREGRGGADQACKKYGDTKFLKSSSPSKKIKL